MEQFKYLGTTVMDQFLLRKNEERIEVREYLSFGAESFIPPVCYPRI